MGALKLTEDGFIYYTIIILNIDLKEWILRPQFSHPTSTINVLLRLPFSESSPFLLHLADGWFNITINRTISGE